MGHDMAQRRKTDAGKTPGQAEKPPGGEVLKFPSRAMVEPVYSKGVAQAFGSMGADLLPELQKFMRLPAMMLRGTGSDLEFYGPLSSPPFPLREEDSPSACLEKGLPAPPWVKDRYLSLVQEGESLFVVFIDAPRKIFLKGDLSRQDEICEKIYDAIISPPGELEPVTG